MDNAFCCLKKENTDDAGAQGVPVQSQGTNEWRDGGSETVTETILEDVKRAVNRFLSTIIVWAQIVSSMLCQSCTEEFYDCF